MTKKGQKLNRPAYKAWWNAAVDENNRLSSVCAMLTGAAQDSCAARLSAESALARERAADVRHRRLALWLGVLDVVFAAAMLYLLATR